MSGQDAAAATPSGEHGNIAAELGIATERYIESLRELGILMAAPCGQIEIDLDRGRAKLGHIVIAEDGVIEIVPRGGITIHQQGELETQARWARHHGPDPAHGWREVADLGWACAVFQPA